MSTRTLTAAINTALSEDVVKPYYALKLDFDTTPIYLWTGLGNRILDGINTYQGVGNLLDIGRTNETSDLSAQGLVLTLSGVDPTILPKALGVDYHGRDCFLYFGILDANDNPSQVEVFSGFMDVMAINEDPESPTIELTVESNYIKLERPNNTRYTASYQKSIHAGDLGLDFVESLQDKTVLWGRV